MSSSQNSVNPSEVGWQFVPQYYTFVNQEPNRLHCFYNKNSTFIHGTEGEDTQSFYGQQVGAYVFSWACWNSCRAGNPQKDHFH